MKKETNQDATPGIQNKNNLNTPQRSQISRRKFVEMTAASAIGFTIVPRHVLGGRNYIAPSDKITLAYIGVGTQGIRELLPLLAVQQIQVTAVCDPNKNAVGYRDWGINYLKSEIRKTLNNNSWEPGGDNTIPGGRDNGKSIVDSYYANVHADWKYNACTAYEDVRELLEKEK